MKLTAPFPRSTSTPDIGMKRLLRTRPVQVFLLSVLFFSCTAVQARERITGFDSWVEVDKSGIVTIIETISVVAEGKEIKRGIYRDFPTDYKDRNGNRFKVRFSVLGVKKDGQPEPYHTKKMNNGIRVYFGDKDIFLKPGPYTYQFTYQTDRQIGFFPDYDELYWNVTGNGWAFPIEVASTTIVLPKGTPVLQFSMYTGRQGSTQSKAKVVSRQRNSIRFQTTAPLAPQEGLTVAVAWPKGVVREPDLKDKAAYYLRDNLVVMVGAAGLLILFFYYISVWLQVGRDPEPGAIIPRFHPPEGFTPAAARFVRRMGFDNKTFGAAIVSLAVKKYLTIEDEQGTFTLIKKKGSTFKVLSKGEKKIARKLFTGSRSLELERSNHKKIGDAISALKKSLVADFETLHFRRNRKYMVPGLIITLLIILSMIFTASEIFVALFMAFWLTGWSAGTSMLIFKTYEAWKSALSGGGLVDKGSALFLTFFSLPFLGGWITGFTIFAGATSIMSVIVLIVVVFLNILFYHLLKAPTLFGRKIMDQLDGLKLYLSVAEKDRLNLLNPPEKTPEHFEELLPWALALDVEQEWGEQFQEILEKARQEGSYDPVWYSSSRPFSSGALASSLGSSLSSSIASSSTAPGSSSGSGGGGSSGGGGGGGGGGGW
jgi:uncharacterized membrane protein